MRCVFVKLKNYFFPEVPLRQAWLVLFICVFSKFIVFDLIWCFQTTFTSFSYPLSYLNKIWISLLFVFPFICMRKPYIDWILMFLLDLFLVANLMYFRTYSMAIPLDNYSLVGNLKDFTASVNDSFRWTDWYFPLSTLGVIFLHLVHYHDEIKIAGWEVKKRCLIRRYIFLTTIIYLLTLGINRLDGGFKYAYESFQSPSKHICCTPIFTLFGTLLYEHLEEQQNINTPATCQKIRYWLEQKDELTWPEGKLEPRKNCIVILAESFESWVLEREVEGIEITPCLNALLKEESTLYAPHVLTQVKAGRSIDAQLLLYTGLLPIQRGVYSIKYPFIDYPSLIKAMKKRSPTRAYCMTVDKKTTWNQNVIARSFGFDTLIYKQNFVLDELITNRERLSDGSFLRQCAQKIREGRWLSDSAGVLIQCVTSTGHNPFILPEPLRRIKFSEHIPQRMNDFMTVANYTDAAIGEFVAFIRSLPEYKNTLIVITGDHEGLADSRTKLAASPQGRGVISTQQFVPFIVVNSPVGMRYNEVMGQIDMYPTLLQLLGLNDYKWTGIGQSILEPDKRLFAIRPNSEVVGEVEGISKQEIKHWREGWDISDLCIRYNYFDKL